MLNWLLLLSNLSLAAASPSVGARWARFHARKYPQLQAEYVNEISTCSRKWLDRACLGDEADTFLSIIHNESNELDPYDDDKLPAGRNSVGFCQTRAQYIPALREFWYLNGYQLGPSDSIDSQCALGVAEFYIHLQAEHGSVWRAVRAYNGKSPAGTRYANRVMRFRARVFGRPWKAGELHQTGSCTKLAVAPNWQLHQTGSSKF